MAAALSQRVTGEKVEVESGPDDRERVERTVLEVGEGVEQVLRGLQRQTGADAETLDGACAVALRGADPTDAEVMAETLTYVVAPPATPEISARVTAEPVSAMRVLQTRPSFEVSMR